MIHKKLIIATLLFMGALCSFAQQKIKNGVVVVRPQHDEHSEKFMTDFATSLRIDGYLASSEVLSAYTRGGFANGILFADKSKNKIYVLTVKDAVMQAKSADIEWVSEGGGSTVFRNCPIAAIDEQTGLAVVELPADAKPHSDALVTFASQQVEDGLDVFSAGYPQLGQTPSWQLSRGIVSNSMFFPSKSEAENLRLIQHTAQTAPSNAGSPLLVRNSKSPSDYEAVGINVWRRSGRENVNFAIPSSTVSAFIERFIQTSLKEKPTPDLKSAVQSLLLSGVHKGGYADILPYISRSYTNSVSAYSYYNLNKAATPDAQALVKTLLTDGKPLEAFRTLVADVIAQQLAQKEFTIKNISDIDVEKGSASVELAHNDTPVSSNWIQEDGEWKINHFSALDIRQLATTQRNAVPDDFYINWYLTGGVQLPFQTNEKMGYGLQAAMVFWGYIPFEAAYYRGSLNRMVSAGYDNKLKKEIFEQKEIKYGSFEARMGFIYPIKINKKLYAIPSLKAILRVDSGDDLDRSALGGIIQATGAYRLNSSLSLLLGCGYKKYFSDEGGDEKLSFGAFEVNFGIAF